MRAILKNTNKYTSIKLASGINLDNTKTTTKQTNSRYHHYKGISSGLYYNKWFNLKKGKAIFKTFETQEQTKNNRIVNELICQELAKQVGLSCAEYELANLDGETGLVSYNVAKNNKKLINGVELCFYAGLKYCNNCIYEYKEAAKIFAQKNSDVNVRQIVLDLYKIAVFDCLTMQTDRHDKNLFFITDSKHNLKVAPLIDNELAFKGNMLYYYTILKSISKENIMDIELECDNVLYIKEQNSMSYANYVKEVVSFAKKNKAAKEVLDFYLTNLNIKKAIESVENKGVEINDGYKEYLVKLFNLAKSEMKNNILELDNLNGK